jgi:hypothetical protein
LLLSIAISYNGTFARQKIIKENHLLKFKNEQGKLVNEVDIRNLNPYQNLPYSIIKLNSQGLPEFDINDERLGSIIEGTPHEVLLTENQKKLEISRASCFYSYFFGDKNVVIAYELYYLIKEHDPVFVEGEIIVLNNNGVEQNRIKGIANGCQIPRITKNGKYVAFMQGDGIKMVISDVYSNVNIFEYSQPTTTLYLPIAFNNLLIFRAKFTEPKYLYYVFDGEKKKLYKKIFTREELNDLKSFSDSGFIFENIDSGEILIPFDEFKQEPLLYKLNKIE